MVVPGRRFKANQSLWKFKKKEKEIVSKKPEDRKGIEKKKPPMEEFLKSLKGEK